MILMIVLQSGASGLLNLLPMLLIFGIFYFFFIRPAAKKTKEQNAFLTDITKGDEVVTSSGIIGRIEYIKGEEVSLQVDPKTYIRFTKGALSKELTEAYRATASKV